MLHDRTPCATGLKGSLQQKGPTGSGHVLLAVEEELASCWGYGSLQPHHLKFLFRAYNPFCLTVHSLLWDSASPTARDRWKVSHPDYGGCVSGNIQAIRQYPFMMTRTYSTRIPGLFGDTGLFGDNPIRSNETVVTK